MTRPHNLRAAVLLTGVALVSALTISQFQSPEGVASDRAESGHAVAASSVTTSGGWSVGGGDVSTREVASPDIFTTLADRRALATRDVARSAERESRLAVDVRRERLAALAAAARVRAAEIQAERDAVIAARKAAEEKARREAEARAAEERVRRVDQEQEAETGTRVSLPISSGYRLSSPFGMRVHPITGVRKLHTGQDFAAAAGTPVRAVAPGRVVEASYAGAWGNRVVIDHGNGTQSWSCHLSAFAVSPGQSVAAGDLIGRVGSTGYSTGAHLHLDIRIHSEPVSPAGWFRQRGIDL